LFSTQFNEIYDSDEAFLHVVAAVTSHGLLPFNDLLPQVYYGVYHSYSSEPTHQVFVEHLYP